MKTMRITLIISAIAAIYPFASAYSENPATTTAAIEIVKRKKVYQVNYDESLIPPYTLPDPLKTEKGRRIRTVRQWENLRRPELMEIFRSQMFGYCSGRPDGMHFKLLNECPDALGGIATRKEIVIYFTADETYSAKLLLYIPNSAKGQKVPAFLGLNFFGNFTTSEDVGITMPTAEEIASFGAEFKMMERGGNAKRWPFEYVLSRGYAVATMHYMEIAPDDAQLFRAAMDKLPIAAEGENHSSYSAIGAWAWGLSRALDYLETDEDIDESKIAVIGHSRLGKTAAWAAASDPRFAIAILNNPGCGGAAISRRAIGENLYVINDAFPHWFCDNFKQYSNNEQSLPFDQHELIAMIAPRPVYIASGSEDKWSDPYGEYLGLVEAAPVYELYGYEVFTDRNWVEIESPQVIGKMGYHIRRGKHEILLYDWIQYLAFVDRFFKSDVD